MYHTIVFMQGDEAEEALKIYEEQGSTEAIKYLSQWDYGTEMEHSPSDNSGAGKSDHIFYEENYVLSVNVPYGYIGLERITNE